MENSKELGQILVQLLVSIPVEKFSVSGVLPEGSTAAVNTVKDILNGESSKVIKDVYGPLLFHQELKPVLAEYPNQPLIKVISLYIEQLSNVFLRSYGETAALHLQLLAIALLQTFIQVNFTGPGIDYGSELFFPTDVQEDAVRALSLDGQQAYELMTDPLFLVISGIIFEKLMNVPGEYSLISKPPATSIETVIGATQAAMDVSNLNVLGASLQWWRARQLQVHMSVLSEPVSILSTLTSLLLNGAILTVLVPYDIEKTLELLFLLENARNGIHSQTEHLAVPLLAKAKKLSGLQLVLSGAKAKRTKYQTFFTSSLVLLAKSQGEDFFGQSEYNDAPEAVSLNSDLLLEKPDYESLHDINMEDTPDSKRIKIDPTSEESDEELLLPLSAKEESISPDLKALDPNKQPPLHNLDNIQLLLRLTTLKQTSPSNNNLVEEQLLAVVQRILYADSVGTNWSLFSRALWERSLLETRKSRTIERGILQMMSLVEEVGLKIKARFVPQSGDTNESPTSSRLRFIHVLPLLPQWNMDISLAEKYMSIGAFKSAVEIYQRLQLANDTALCYAAVGEEKEAERILVERIKTHPYDARTVSILGDVKQDPNLWLKAWEIGRYSKAKSSLSHYYYNPPVDSGLTKNLDLAIKHMNDCLTVNPLSFEDWFFYGVCGLESAQFELASEAFTRCVTLDETSSYSWTNLASALLKLDKTRQAFNALKNALKRSKESQLSWKIYENYLTVAAKLGEWNDVLIALTELIKIRGEEAIDLAMIEGLVDVLVATDFPEEGQRMTHFQSSAIGLLCNTLPSVITTSARAWRSVSRVELWRKKPWNALLNHEKAYRALSNNPDLEFQESVWNHAVDVCADLVAAYESYGEMPGKHGAGDLVCKDWKYKARTSVRSLMSKGKSSWEDTEGWDRLREMKEELT